MKEVTPTLSGQFGEKVANLRTVSIALGFGALALVGCSGEADPAPTATEVPTTATAEAPPTEDLPLICPQSDADHPECANNPN